MGIKHVTLASSFVLHLGWKLHTGKMQGEWTNCLQWKDRDLETYSDPLNQSLFWSFRSPLVKQYLSTQLFLLYAGQGCQAPRRSSLPNSSPTLWPLNVHQNIYNEEPLSRHLRIGLIISQLLNLCRKANCVSQGEVSDSVGPSPLC